MPRVSWSKTAQGDLVEVVKLPDLIDQLKANAEVTLHDVTIVSIDEGVEGETMWHRGFTHEQEHQIKTNSLPEPPGPGPQVWDFYLFYRRRRPMPGYEVIHVRSNGEVAAYWRRQHPHGE